MGNATSSLFLVPLLCNLVSLPDPVSLVDALVLLLSVVGLFMLEAPRHKETFPSEHVEMEVIQQLESE